MIPNATIVTCLISLLVSTVLPIAVIIFYARKHRGEKLLSTWLLGALGFFVTQILIRVPILTVLSSQIWFLSFAENHSFLYAFSLAFTAGLFELAGRFAVAKCIHKKLTFHRSFAAGLGHGGIEAMLLVGTTYISNLIFIFMIRTGTFDALIAQTASTGVDVSQLYMLKDSLISTHPTLFLLAGFERILAMTAHVGMSLIVCYSLYNGTPFKGALLCLVLHTMIDLTAGINLLTGSVLSPLAAYIIIYTILMIAATISVFITKLIYKLWSHKEVTHDF